MKQKLFFRVLLLIISSGLFFSCSNQKNLDEIPEIDIRIKCSNTDIQITENDSLAISNSLKPAIWRGFHNINSVQIYFTKEVSSDGETETFTAIFSKVNNCLKIERAYKFYDGKQVDVSAITEVVVLDFDIKTWEIDDLFLGIITYLDPHDKETYSRKFWIKLTSESTQNESLEPFFFKNCVGDLLPLDIDLDKDGNIDFKLTYEEINDTGNKPRFSYYIIKLVSTNQSINQILSPKRNNSPYFVVFEPPFSSENTKQYLEDVKNELDVFYEFEVPYEKYNYFLSNKLTYREILTNNLKDYFVVSLFIDGKNYFGWIQFELDSANCTVKIVETYLNPIPDEHIFVN